MKLFAVFFVFCVGVAIGKPVEESSPSLHISFERYVAAMEMINSSPMLRREWVKHVNQLRDDAAMSAPQRFQTLSLSCAGSHRSPTKPSSAHKLRIGDIDLIAAMGDSLTAGNGILAWTILGCLTEYRGRSWSIGGDSNMADGITTVPNILRNFNSNVRGFSTGDGDVNSRGAQMNVASAGHIAQDMPGQASMLVDRLRSDPNVDFENDWKMVTVFIGGNNLCAFCNDLNAHSADTYIANIAEALDILHNNVPRMFVNLVEMFDITPVADLASGLICNFVHGAVCSCRGDRAGLTELSQEYQRAVQDLVASGRYDNKDDFTVVVQPFFRQTVPPQTSSGPDMSYFAPDCFHFSSKGHNAAGKALWNNILQPIRSKGLEWGLNDAIACPQTEFIPTRKN